MKAIKQRNRLPQDVQDDRLKQGILTKETIFSIIAASEPLGKSSAELREETGLSRDRIHTLCKEYIDEGLLYKTARYGKYHLTQKALGDPARKGYLFCLKSMKELLSLEYISANSLFSNASQNSRLLNNKKDAETVLLVRQNPNIIDRLLLFEFALRIGAIMTYEMIMAIKLASEARNVRSTAKDWRAWNWMKDAMNSQLILAAFARTDLVGKRLKRNTVTTSDDMATSSLYDMDPEGLQSLQESFQKVFPEVYQKSEKILSGLQSRIDFDRHYMKEVSEKDKRMEKEDPDHTKCVGERIPKIVTSANGIKFQKCLKCHRWIPVKKSKSR